MVFVRDVGQAEYASRMRGVATDQVLLVEAESDRHAADDGPRTSFSGQSEMAARTSGVAKPKLSRSWLVNTTNTTWSSVRHPADDL